MMEVKEAHFVLNKKWGNMHKSKENKMRILKLISLKKSLCQTELEEGRMNR